VRALALGAPLEYGAQRKLRYCSGCEAETDCELRQTEDGSAVVARCRQCGTETGRWYEGSMPGDAP
jgi:RNase P subunit RPR2